MDAPRLLLSLPYTDGDFVLTVRELSSWSRHCSTSPPRASNRAGPTPSPIWARARSRPNNGSMVVRKDWKILTVDISGLPARFGKPPTSRGDVAVTVADLILACWAGD